MSKDFLPAVEFFERLVGTLPPQQFETWQGLRHQRVETAFIGRKFVVYQMVDGEPKVMDTLTFTDIVLSAKHGLKAIVESKRFNTDVEVGYAPSKMPGIPAFMCLPLHTKLRFSSTGNIHNGKLGFPVMLKVQSRVGPRDEGVAMVETSTDFMKEFNKTPTDF